MLPPVVSHGFDVADCPRDTLPETVCGSRRDTLRSCGGRATNLASIDESKLYVTDADEDDDLAAFRGFRFDRHATHHYRQDIDDASSAENACCYSSCTPMEVGVAAAMPAASPGYVIQNKCVPAPPGGTSRPARENRACPIGIAFDGTLRPYVSTDGSECCYAVVERQITIHAIPGRALRIDGQPHVAGVGDGDGWRADLAPDLAISDDVRARLAAVWLEAARLEHASIAAFSSLALRLVAAGAPAELVAAAHRAALDEIEHARISFELASAYAGRRLAPGEFEAALRAPTAGSLRELALETFVDGCINETAAAHHAEVAAAGAIDPVVASALHGIAGDEARHAELAWAVIAWCLREGAVSVEELRAIASRAGGEAAPRDEDLAPHGVLGDAATAAIRTAVLGEVVDPCLAALSRRAEA